MLTPTEVARLAEATEERQGRADHHRRRAQERRRASREDGMLTWKFRAKNVRDAVLAASPDYQWDATSYKGAYAFGYYRPSAADLWEESADMARMSIQEYSERWFPYP